MANRDVTLIAPVLEYTEPSPLEQALARIELLEDRVKDLTFTVDNLEQQLVDLDATDETARELSRLEDTVSDMETDVEDLKREQENTTDNLDDLQNQLNELERRVDNSYDGVDE